MASVLVIGAGVVGAATGAALAGRGHNVRFVDIDARRVSELIGAGFDATTTLSLGRSLRSNGDNGLPSPMPEVIFLAVPTPNRGHCYDLGYLRAAVGSLGAALASYRSADPRNINNLDDRDGFVAPIVAVRSTVPPGTTDTVVTTLLEEATGTTEGELFLTASTPEFLRATTAADDAAAPWMTVIGARRPQARERLTQLFEPFGGELVVFDDPVTSEMIKCVHNVFNAAKISFWNEMWTVCRALGIDPDQVATTVARSAEGSFNPFYGIRGGAPFGGACLPKDSAGFLGVGADLGLHLRVTRAAVEVNDDIARLVGQELDVAADSPGWAAVAGRPEPAVAAPAPIWT
ncbi:MAG: UDP-glucose/GDP-mannose dehydrogenase family protein [Acidimicrobiales bacterium]